MDNKWNPNCCAHVAQDPSLDWCFEACLESFLRDNKRFTTQMQMVERAKEKGLCNDKGVVSVRNDIGYSKLKDFCALFDIDFEQIDDRKIRGKIEDREAVLIGAAAKRWCAALP
jgi:hypothetical protein